jgi:hypothetical protein
MTPVPAQPRRDDTAADAATLEELGIIPEQPTPSPEPPPPPVYDDLAAT